MKRSLAITATLLFSAAYPFGQKDIVTSQAIKQNGSLYLTLQVKKGYGIQKKGKNSISVYELANSAATTVNATQKPVKTLTSIKGNTATEDKEYHSELEPITIPIKNKGANYLIKGKLYYCSFSDKFCSITSFSQVVR